MKLPKGFGGQGFGAMLQQAQGAMARAQQLNEELEAERIGFDQGPIKMIFNGLGELQAMKLDPSVVDPNDVEGLEDMIVAAVRAGFTHAVELREAKMKEILPNVPDIPGLTS
jgi:nucleoid-associated protein EbfC